MEIAERSFTLCSWCPMKETFLKLSDEKRLYILNSAAEIFARAGYHQAAIADICANAGISNGALYKYFNNKEDLFLSIIDYGIALVAGLYRRFDASAPVLPTLRAIFQG